MYKVMIVDDSPAIIKELSDLIDWENFDFTLTGSYTSARGLLVDVDKDQPDLLITDISMPEMDGIELAAEMTKRNPDISIVFLSAYTDFEYARSGLRLRVFDYLLKPVQISQLTDVMSRLLTKLREKEEEKLRMESEKNFYRNVALTHCLTKILHSPEKTYHIEEELLQLRVKLPPVYHVYVASIAPALPPDSLACFSQEVQVFFLESSTGQSTVLILYEDAVESPSISDLLSIFCVDVETRWKTILSIGYSTPASSLALLPELYEESRQALGWLEQGKSLVPFISFTNIHIGNGAPSSRKRSKSFSRENVSIMRNYIHDNYNMCGISKKDVAASAHLSPNYGNVLFSEECGVTIFEYLTQYRMEKARRLLTETDIYVTKVAELVGYENKTSFYLMFKRKFGMSPAEYRQKHTVY